MSDTAFNSLTLWRLNLKYFWTLMSMFYNDVQMDDGSVNSQEYKSFEIYAVTIKISMTEYHQSTFNKPSDWWFILTQQSIWWKMSMVNPVTCLFFHFFEALNDSFWSAISFKGFIFYSLSKTLIAGRVMQIRFCTWLNNALNLFLHNSCPNYCSAVTTFINYLTTTCPQIMTNTLHKYKLHQF